MVGDGGEDREKETMMKGLKGNTSKRLIDKDVPYKQEQYESHKVSSTDERERVREREREREKKRTREREKENEREREREKKRERVSWRDH